MKHSRDAAAQPLPGVMTLDKYLALARASFRRRLGERSVLIGRVVFYGLLLLVFSRVWQTVLPAPALADAAAPAAVFGEYVWYLVVTEWIMLSQPSVHIDVQNEVQSGDVVHQLGRPVSYVGSKLAEAVGDLVLRLAVTGAAGLAYGRFFAGYWPEPGRLAAAAVVALVSSALMLLCLLCIGLCAFWLHDCMPIYWVWQKLVFVLGGLTLPLSIYPAWLQSAALASPFAAMLYGPGRLVMGEQTDPVALALQLIGWCAVAAGAAVLLERRALRRLVIEGS